MSFCSAENGRRMKMSVKIAVIKENVVEMSVKSNARGRSRKEHNFVLCWREKKQHKQSWHTRGRKEIPHKNLDERTQALPVWRECRAKQRICATKVIWRRWGELEGRKKKGKKVKSINIFTPSPGNWMVVSSIFSALLMNSKARLWWYFCMRKMSSPASRRDSSSTSLLVVALVAFGSRSGSFCRDFSTCSDELKMNLNRTKHSNSSDLMMLKSTTMGNERMMSVFLSSAVDLSDSVVALLAEFPTFFFAIVWRGILYFALNEFWRTYWNVAMCNSRVPQAWDGWQHDNEYFMPKWLRFTEKISLFCATSSRFAHWQSTAETIFFLSLCFDLVQTDRRTRWREIWNFNGHFGKLIIAQCNRHAK